MNDRMVARKACVIGCGLKGLSTAIMLSRAGHKVKLFDSDDMVVAALSKGEVPFIEPDLSSMLAKGIRNRTISIADDVNKAVKESEFIFIAVHVPILRAGKPNLSNLKDAAKDAARSLAKGKTVVVKCTVPPGTTESAVMPILEKISRLKAGKDFGLAYCPSFIRAGRAASDIERPSRIVVGGINQKTADDVLSLLKSVNVPKISTDIRTAEVIKYASSGYLATKIAFAEEMANLSETFGVDAKTVLDAVGLDPRIGTDLLSPSIGFGGTCLPRDLSAMIASAESGGMRPDILRAVKKVNDRQAIRAVEMLEEELGQLRGRRIAILGLAFKAGLGDVSDSKALAIAVALLARGAKVVGYDPLASAAFIKLLPGIGYASSAAEALLDSDGCIIQTEEEEFARLTRGDFDLMRTKVVIDGRRILSPTKLSKCGVRLRAIGLGRN